MALRPGRPTSSSEWPHPAQAHGVRCGHQVQPDFIHSHGRPPSVHPAAHALPAARLGAGILQSGVWEPGGRAGPGPRGAVGNGGGPLPAGLSGAPQAARGMWTVCSPPRGRGYKSYPPPRVVTSRADALGHRGPQRLSQAPAQLRVPTPGPPRQARSRPQAGPPYPKGPG